MSNNGWMLLHRKIQSNWLWTDKPFARGQAWIDLLMLANFEEGKVMSKGILVDVQRGQVFRTIKFLSDRWGWNPKKVRVFLETLERESMVTLKGLSNGTLITIENYTFYNGEGQTECTSNDTTEDTPRGEQRASQGSHKNKNKEEIKKNKKELNNKHTYGEMNNVRLTDDELEKLKKKFPYDYNKRIDDLSIYISSKGDKYKSHYSTILSWSRKNNDAPRIVETYKEPEREIREEDMITDEEFEQMMGNIKNLF